ncbi:rod shape-determining protein MreD [Paenibacillus crassostreae]|uniref:Rod shape-determining protein MreD n=1 Tax=Paenibacillus crassostreae TaxID=1763538 RepID=A0A167EEM7_9BACL|nr:rod shape-determining protein MreD [Paenibacillus crassostreae]AOZ91908.1 rod shape-determining protein MreD [Paenibacillus crassostreae]OAB75461.1 rod shape-determining protein MreD [Paenibacillus crassostreae]
MIMRRPVLIMLLFLLFVLEGTIVPWITPDTWQSRIVPNLVYIVILFVSIYYHRHTALVLGIIFGMLHDIVFYGQIMGPYSFSMGFSAYCMGFIFQSPRAPMPIMMSVILLGSLLLDSVLFGIYTLFQMNHSTYDWALVHHILPNLFVHFVFGLVIYVPLRSQLEKVSKLSQKEKVA